MTGGGAPVPTKPPCNKLALSAVVTGALLGCFMFLMLFSDVNRTLVMKVGSGGGDVDQWQCPRQYQQLSRGRPCRDAASNNTSEDNNSTSESGRSAPSPSPPTTATVQDTPPPSSPPSPPPPSVYSSLLQRALLVSAQVTARYCDHPLPQGKMYDESSGSHTKVYKMGADRPTYDTFINLTAVVHQHLVENNITCMLTCGSLIGSYMFHDMIPWDDDMDLMIPKSSLKQALVLLNQIEGLRAELIDSRNIIKVFEAWRDPLLPRTHLFYWGYPFIDIFLIQRNEKDGLWSIPNEPKYKWPHEVIFPPALRPFGLLWLHAPRQTAHFLRIRYGARFQCNTQSYSHKYEGNLKNVKTFECGALVGVVPLVYPHTCVSGSNHTSAAQVIGCDPHITSEGEDGGVTVGVVETVRVSKDRVLYSCVIPTAENRTSEPLTL